jgi:tRNA(Ile2) C34 agmatinyltransferase TiaS
MTIATQSSDLTKVLRSQTVACADCGEDLRADDDVRCRWCDDNRARRPEDYELVAAELPEAVAS